MSKPYKLPISYQDHLPFDTGHHFEKTVEARLIQTLSQELVFTIDAKYMPRSRGDRGESLYTIELLGSKAPSPAAYTQAMLDTYLGESIAHVSTGDTGDTSLSLIAPDGVALYTIDLTPIVKEQTVPVDLAATILRRRGGVLGLSLAINGAPHMARVLLEENLRPNAEVACGDTYRFSGFSNVINICQRPKDHIGSHMQITPERGGYAKWEDGGGMSTWDDFYGIITTCVECDMPTLDITKHLCDTDSYWSRQATEDLNTAFVVEGSHYRPGKGGFGGQIFNLERFDGTTWRGELFGQGPVPDRWRDRIPDNTKIVSTERPRVTNRRY